MINHVVSARAINYPIFLLLFILSQEGNRIFIFVHKIHATISLYEYQLRTNP